uniref:Uncharacterized protein n=1 Tax=Opuntia streptacantha TaxID=393608 RepID=A0A7C9DQY2_OPUST
MAYSQRLGGYGATYYEAEKEVVRGPGDCYSSEYRVEEYGNPSYPPGYRHNGGYATGVTEVVSYESNPGFPSHRHHHHHLGGPTEVIEKREEIIYDNICDPYRRVCT